ncbi:hypothetical protein RD792_016872, partial [Penstemon davidsonii]
ELNYMASSINHQNLIEDVILEILSRLPVKTLSRFKCVCKLWYTLIESPSFINRHLSHENNRERLLVRHCGPDDEYAYALYLDDNLCEYEEPDHWQMLLKVGILLGPLNGIFCSIGINRQMALLNPATRKFRPIPFRNRDTPPHLTMCEDIFGFGMDPVSGNYKLVSLRYFWNEETNVAHYPSLVSVYNSGNDSWRYFEDANLVNSSRSTNKSLCNTFLNGVYYWLTESNENVAILAFDMSNEVFRDIKTPDCIKPKEGELALCGDSITLLSYDPDKVNKYVDIWEISLCFPQTFPTHVILKDRDVNIWRVKVKKVRGKWFFQKGWLKFVKDNSLEIGDMVLFEYVDEYFYDVTLYGHSSSEKKGFGHDEDYDRDDEKEDNEQVTHVMGSIPPTFFKFITPACLNQLEISRTFPQTFPTHVYLKDRDVNIWRVKVKEVGGKLFFQKGWKKFVKANSLEIGDMVVFKYVDEYVFDVTQYGLSGTEKKGFGHDEDYDTDDEKKDNEQVTHDDIGGSPKINRKSRCYGKDIFEAGLAPVPSNPYFVTKINPKRRSELLLPVNFITDHKYLDLPEEMMLIDPNNREYWVSYGKWSDGRSLYRGSGLSELHQRNGVDGDDICIFEFIKKPGSQDLHMKEISRTFPQTFPTHVYLKDRDVNIWRVKVKEVGGKLFFQKGWKKFVKANSLEIGDMVVFKYVDEYVFDVTQYGLSGTEKKAFGHDEDYDTDDKKKDNEQVTHDDIGGSPKINRKSRCYGKDIFEAGLAPVPSNPYFVTKINPKRRSELLLPVNFITDHKYLDLPEEMMLIDPNNREYWVSYGKWSDGRSLYRGSGLSELHQRNGVDGDDICIFEFIKKPGSEDLHMKVNFVRAKHDWRQGSNGDKHRRSKNFSLKRARLN